MQRRGSHRKGPGSPRRPDVRIDWLGNLTLGAGLTMVLVAIPRRRLLDGVPRLLRPLQPLLTG